MVLRRTTSLVPPNGPAKRDQPQARLLYVEDDDASWQITERYLRERYVLERATNSDQAFSLLAARRFDLILLDIELAGSKYDGITICRILRQRTSGRDVPIVFVTAYSSRYSKEALIAAGADEIVTKPVDYTRLLLVTSRLIVGGVIVGQ